MTGDFELNLFYLIVSLIGMCLLFGVCAFVCDKLEARRERNARRRSRAWG